MSCDWRIRANGQPSCGAPILPAAVRWRVAALTERWRPAAIRPCAEQIQPSGGLFLHISWANVDKMPTLLEGPSRSGGVLAAMAHARSKSSRLAAFFLHISWANVGKMPTLLEGPSRSGGVLAAMAHVQSKSSRLAASSCTSHGQMWARCPLSLSAPQGVVASRRHGPCAEQIQPSGGLLLPISWANVGKMPTLLEGVKKHAKVESEAHPFPPVQIHN